MRRVWWLYLLVTVPVTAGYPLLPGSVQPYWYDAVSASVIVALLIGAGRSRPGTRLPWYLFAAGQCFYFTADVVWNYLNSHGHDIPTPSILDVVYLAYYPLVGWGLLLLARRRASGSWSAAVDALTAGTGVALVVWVLISPSVLDPDLSLGGRLANLAYPVADLVLLILALGLALASGQRSVAFRLLIASMVTSAGADLLFLIVSTHDPSYSGAPTDMLWLAGYLAFAATALHPTMGGLGEPSPQRITSLNRWRLAMLAGCGLFAPAVPLLGPTLGGPAYVATFALGCTMLYALLLTRILSVVRRQERALGREKILRMGGRGLVVAENQVDIDVAARRSGSRLVGPEFEVRMVSDVDARDRLAGAADGQWIEPDGRLVRLIGVTIGEQVQGGIEVTGPRALDPLVRQSLASLAAEVALAQQSMRREQQRLLTEHRFRSIVHTSSDLMFITRPDGTIVWCGQSVERICGWSPDDLPGQRITSLLHPGDSGVLDYLSGTLSPDEAYALGDWRLRLPDGAYRVFQMTGRNLLHDPAVAGLVLTGPDVTDRRQMEDDLREQAFHDRLTGLANRSLFTDRLAHALARRNTGPREVAVLFIDLDDFKTVNDSLGHQAGDELLVIVAQRVRGALSPADTVARLGGDEFAVLLEDVTEDIAVHAAEAVLEALVSLVPVAEREMYVRASIGVAVSSDQAACADTLLRNADVAMYRAKAAGKGRYEMFRSSMHAAAVERLELQGDLQRALERDELVVYYQPIVDLNTGQPASFEALVRWQHPQRGLVGPDEFIPIAEETGLIVAIGRFVLRTACGQAYRWQHKFKWPMTMAVNVSVRQLADPRFVDDVRAALADSGLAPASLTLEVTESAFAADMDAAITLITEVRAMGVRIAIDDFGTGYSSLSYLDRFPVDIIKIDRSFVSVLTNQTGQPPLVQMILDLARSMNVKTVAEGVEDVAQFARLRELGCYLGQGFLFSRPLDPQALERVLAGGQLTPAPTAAAAVG